MEFFSPRKLKFKAWNTETRLLMQLNTIDCVKRELVKSGHILLQFTGMYDKLGEELYDMDVVLKDNNKYVIHWNSDCNAWSIGTIISNKNTNDTFAASKKFTTETIRLRSYFEAGEN